MVKLVVPLLPPIFLTVALPPRTEARRALFGDIVVHFQSEAAAVQYDVCTVYTHSTYQRCNKKESNKGLSKSRVEGEGRQLEDGGYGEREERLMLCAQQKMWEGNIHGGNGNNSFRVRDLQWRKGFGCTTTYTYSFTIHFQGNHFGGTLPRVDLGQATSGYGRCTKCERKCFAQFSSLLLSKPNSAFRTNGGKFSRC